MIGCKWCLIHIIDNFHLVHHKIFLLTLEKKFQFWKELSCDGNNFASGWWDRPMIRIKLQAHSFCVRAILMNRLIRQQNVKFWSSSSVSKVTILWKSTMKLLVHIKPRSSNARKDILPRKRKSKLHINFFVREIPLKVSAFLSKLLGNYT